MKLYRDLKPFKLISFDLDDTLYDNSLVIEQAEQQFLQYLQTTCQLPQLTKSHWLQWKHHIEQQDPIFCEDVTAWRERTVQEILIANGKTVNQAQRLSQQSILYFLDWRHRIEVPELSLYVLNQLKQHYPITVITNGNVEPTRIGLEDFVLYLRGGKHGRAKPHADLFQQTAQKFGLEPTQILHVGDNLITDVQGAIQAGCQAVWINTSNQNIEDFSESPVSPTVEISKLDLLLNLL